MLDVDANVADNVGMLIRSREELSVKRVELVGCLVFKSEKHHETHLPSKHNAIISFYRTYGPQSPHVFGGTGIFVQDHIPRCEVLSSALNTVQATKLSISNESFSSLTISFLYLPNKIPSNDAINDLASLTSINYSSILCGDFNTHYVSWRCRNINQEIFSLILQLSLVLKL
ncbi:hypothetical protein CDAR_221111 [Caerostris darwini]|uniref:Endonuclease/exonuclease/phosphatase domain-containing protein n=1 Tax=Caerostris darwini TaxID=1538125 RepID=A0AAV4R2M7_9ARAC|nr:hypothetical protein CDAR_221111 [Caerostris darwini]